MEQESVPFTLDFHLLGIEENAVYTAAHPGGLDLRLYRLTFPSTSHASIIRGYQSKNR